MTYYSIEWILKSKKGLLIKESLKCEGFFWLKEWMRSDEKKLDIPLAMRYISVA
jgi:hypothetical protein